MFARLIWPASASNVELHINRRGRLRRTGEWWPCLLGVIAALLGAVGWFLWRELKNNDEGHRHLRADIKKFETDVQKLLAGHARIEGLLEGVVGGGPHRG